MRRRKVKKDTRYPRAKTRVDRGKMRINITKPREDNGRAPTRRTGG